jgi:phage-related minor tail protein
MMRCVISLALAVVATELAGCSGESAGKRLTRECREIVDGATDSENATNPDVATVKREDMEAVIRSEQWAMTPLRKAIQAELHELETSRGYTSDQFEAAWDRVVNKGGERDAIWRAAFDNDLPRRERIRDMKIRECLANRERKEGAR